jgi:6-phosphogluconate dehydrogenase
LTAIEFLESPDLAKVTGRVSDSGEGRWTGSSRGEADFADKLLSAMRYGFGGYAKTTSTPKGGPG